MAKNIESKIVDMQFENRQFERGINTSLKSLTSFNNQLSAMDQTSALTKMADSIDNISKHFTVMGQVGFAVIQKLTWAAMDLAKSLIMPLSAFRGFQEYELTINSIQTLMAGTGESLERVNEKLAELNRYSDETIYSFSDMTSNIGKFTNAGVKLDDAVAAMKGIANAAALAGANANEASRAMYNFGQSMALGFVELRDWRSIEQANMGTLEFKQNILDIAVEMGTVRKLANGMYQALTPNRSGQKANPATAVAMFSQGLQYQWFTAEILTKVLNRYADETDEVGKRATAAAKRVSTFSKMMDTLKEGMQSGWAQSMQLIIGDFGEATKFWSTMAALIGKVTDYTAKNRNEMLKLWKTAGGRDAFIEGIANAAIALRAVLLPIREAWKEIFPPKSGSLMVDLLKSFSQFTNSLIINKQVASDVANVFKSFFIVIKAGLTTAKTAVSIFMDLAGRALPVMLRGFRLLTDVVSYFYNLLSPYIITGFSIALDKLGTVMDYVSSKTGNLISWFENLFTTFKATAAESGLLVALSESIDTLFISMKKLPASVAEGFKSILLTIEGMSDRFPVLSGIASNSLNAISKATTFFKNTLTSLSDGLSSVISFLNPFDNSIQNVKKTLVPSKDSTGIFDGLLAGLTNLNPFKKVADASKEITTSVVAVDTSLKTVLNTSEGIGYTISLIASNIKNAISGFIDSLSTMSGMEMLFGALNAAILVGFASISFTIVKSLTLATGRILGGVGQIFLGVGELSRGVAGITEGLESITKGVGRALTGFGILNVLKGFSLAIITLTGALLALSFVPFNKLVQGTIVIAAFMAAIVLAMKQLDSIKGANSIAAAIAALSISLFALGSTIKKIGSLDVGTLAKGLIGVSVGLLAIIGPLSLLSNMMQGTSFLGVGASILSLTAGLKLISGSIKAFGNLDLSVLAKGVIGVSLSLLSLVAPLMLLTIVDTTKLVGINTAILATAVSIRILAGAVKSISKVENLGKTFLVFVGIVGTLSAVMIGLAKLNTTYDMLAVTKSIGAIASSIGLLALAMIPLTVISWGTIIKSLVLLGGALVGLLAAGAVFSYFPSFAKGATLFAKALNILGKALVGIGAGIGLFAISLMLLGTAGSVGLVGLSAFMVMLSGVAPLIRPVLGVLAGLGVSLAFLGAGILALGTGFALLDKRGTAGILIMGAIFTAMVVFADQVKKLAPAMLQVTLSVGILAGAFWLLTKMIKDLEFMTTVKLAVIGGALLLFVKLLGDSVDESVLAASAVGILSASLYFLSGALGAATLAGGLLVIGVAAIILSFAVLVAATAELIQTLENVDGKKIGQNFVDIGGQIVEGLIQGVKNLTKRAVDAFLGLVGKCVTAVKKFLGIASPSKVFYDFGKNSAEGYINGISDNTDKATNAVTNLVGPGLNVLGDSVKNFAQYGRASSANYATGLVDPTIEQAVGAAGEMLANKANQMMASRLDGANAAGRAVGREFGAGLEIEGNNAIGKAIDSMAYNFGFAIGKLQTVVEGWLYNLGGWIDQIMRYLATIPGRIWTLIQQVWANITAWFSVIQAFFSKIWAWLTSVHFDIGEILYQITKLIVDFFGNLGQNLFLLGAWVMGLFEGLLESLMSKYGKYILSLFIALINPIAGAAALLASALTDIINWLFGSVNTHITSKVKEGYSDAIGQTEQEIKALTPRLQSAIDDALGKNQFKVPDSFKDINMEEEFGKLVKNTEDATKATASSWDLLAETVADKTGMIGLSVDQLKEKFGDLSELEIHDLIKGFKSGDFSVLEKILGEFTGTTGLGASTALDKLREAFNLDAFMEIGTGSGKALGTGMNGALGTETEKTKKKTKDLLSSLDKAVMDLSKKWTAMTVAGYVQDKINMKSVQSYTNNLVYLANEAKKTENALSDLQNAEQELSRLQEELSQLDLKDTNARRANRESQARVRRNIAIFKKENAAYNQAIQEITKQQEAADKAERQARFDRAYDELYAEYLAKGKLIQQEFEYSTDGGNTMEKMLSDTMTLPKETIIELKAKILEDSNAIREFKRITWEKELAEEKKLREDQAAKQQQLEQDIPIETQKVTETANKEISDSIDTMTTTASDKSKEVTKALASPLSELVVQMEIQKPTVSSKAGEIVDAMLLAITSKTSSFKDAAGSLVQAFTTGLLGSEEVNILITFTNLLNEVHLSTTGWIEKFNAVGLSIAEGLAKGIESGEASAINAAIKLAQNALRAAKRALGIASPSKMFTSLGEFCADGLAKGITDSQSIIALQNGSALLAKTMSDTYASAINKESITMKHSISKALEQISMPENTEPTIRPVVDFTEIDKIGSHISNQLSSNYTPGIPYLSSTRLANKASNGFNENIAANNLNITTPTTAIQQTQPSLTINLTNNVRNDSDIQKISREMNSLIRRQGYALGNVI